MAQLEVVVLSGVRTPIGDYGGSLKDRPPTELGASVVSEAVKRAGIKPEEVEHVVFGNVIHTDVHDMYLARVAAVNAGIPVETPASDAQPPLREWFTGDCFGSPDDLYGRCQGNDRRRCRSDEPQPVLATRGTVGSTDG